MPLPLALRLKLRAYERLAPQRGGKLVAKLFTTPRAHSQPEWEKELVARGTPIALAEGIAGTQWGAPNGPPVILLHGWEGRGAQLGYFVEPLVSLGHRVIAMDGPAHGASTGDHANPFEFAKALMAVQANLGPFRAVIGHSMGGAAAKIAASRGLRVERIVLLGAPSSLPEVFARFSDFMGLGPKVREAFKNTMVARTGIQIEPLALLPEIADKSLPVLIAHDIKDAEVPLVDAHLALRAYPNAQLLELDAGGHRKMLKSPDVVAAVSRFIGPR
jgi:pimeloyl-ACP methyl ester carboxylesterase